MCIIISLLDNINCNINVNQYNILLAQTETCECNAAYHFYIIKQFSINSVIIYFLETSLLE